MTKVKRKLGGRVCVAGAEYEWHLSREPRHCGPDGWKGIAVAVHLVDGQREAILEWSMPWEKSRSIPSHQRPTVSVAMIEKGVAAALEAGWVPTSRGRPVTIEIE